jgi:hypothetical protein
MRNLVWTVRIEGRREPSLWLTHEGVESARIVERYVDKCTSAGLTVLVNLTRTARRHTNMVDCREVR